MATCRDCLHDEACRSMLTAMGYTVNGDGNEADKRCDTFKAKTKYAEVVRCKDCIHRLKDNWAKCIGRKPEDFCSDGESRWK